MIDRAIVNRIVDECKIPNDPKEELIFLLTTKIEMECGEKLSEFLFPTYPLESADCGLPSDMEVQLENDMRKIL